MRRPGDDVLLKLAEDEAKIMLKELKSAAVDLSLLGERSMQPRVSADYERRSDCLVNVATRIARQLDTRGNVR